MTEKQYEILALTLRYWFVLLIGYVFFRSLKACWRAIRNGHWTNRETTGNIPFILVLLSISAFGLLALREPEGIEIETLLLGVLISALFLLQYSITVIFFKKVDRYLLLMADTLAIIGLILLQRLNPSLAYRQAEWFGIGSVALLILIVITRRWRGGKKLGFLLGACALVLLILPLVIGEETYGAKNWIHIGGRSIQPSEFVKIILIFVFAGDFSKVKSFKERLPVLMFTAASILLVVLQKDLGAALLYFALFVFLYYIGTSDFIVTAGSITAAILGAVLSYKLFAHVRVRVEAWKNPWADIEDKGYQIAQSLIAIGSGGLVGLGLGLGSPNIVPASKTDLIFAAICEEMGILTGLFIIGFYILIMVRGVSIALRVQKPFYALLSMGAMTALVIQSFIIIGGVIKLIPLTGVTMPFVSYGGSSMLVSMALIGILEGAAAKIETHVQDKNGEPDNDDEALDDDEYGVGLDDDELYVNDEPGIPQASYEVDAEGDDAFEQDQEEY